MNCDEDDEGYEVDEGDEVDEEDGGTSWWWYWGGGFINITDGQEDSEDSWSSSSVSTR